MIINYIINDKGKPEIHAFWRDKDGNKYHKIDDTLVPHFFVEELHKSIYENKEKTNAVLTRGQYCVMMINLSEGCV